MSPDSGGAGAAKGDQKKEAEDAERPLAAEFVFNWHAGGEKTARLCLGESACGAIHNVTLRD
jgi:hypothetical protein